MIRTTTPCLKLRGSAGFTLVELVISVAIFGMVVASMLSLYITMQRTTNNQDDIVDVQQNVRVAMDYLGRDIKMAGALIPVGTAPVATGSNAANLKLLTASSFYALATVAADVEVDDSSSGPQTFQVVMPTMADKFDAGHVVRIIRPQSGLQPFDADLTVTAASRGDVTDGNPPPTITVTTPGTAGLVQVKAGDVIARVSSAAGAPDPSTIDWDFNGGNGGTLRRDTDNTGASVVADDILLTDVDGNLTSFFSYLLDDGSEVTVPTNDQLADIRAIRVTVTALADAQTDGTVKPRSISSVVRLRN